MTPEKRDQLSSLRAETESRVRELEREFHRYQWIGFLLKLLSGIYVVLGVYAWSYVVLIHPDHNLAFLGGVIASSSFSVVKNAREFYEIQKVEQIYQRTLVGMQEVIELCDKYL